MGYLIPENIPSRSDLPESVQNVAAYLRDNVDDEVTVWLESTDTETCGLLILDPAAGLVLVDCPRQSDLGLRRRRGLFARIRKAPAVKDVWGMVRERSAPYERLLDAETNLGADFRTAATVALPMVDRAHFRRLGLGEDPDSFILDEDFEKSRLRPALARVLGQRRALRHLSEYEEKVV